MLVSSSGKWTCRSRTCSTHSFQLAHSFDFGSLDDVGLGQDTKVESVPSVQLGFKRGLQVRQISGWRDKEVSEARKDRILNRAPVKWKLVFYALRTRTHAKGVKRCCVKIRLEYLFPSPEGAFEIAQDAHGRASEPEKWLGQPRLKWDSAVSA